MNDMQAGGSPAFGEPLFRNISQQKPLSTKKTKIC
jgi:hypothetical protein